MVESSTPDNPIKNQYIITIESKTIEVYAESIAEALSLSGLPVDSTIQFEKWLIERGSYGSISENRIVLSLVSVNDHSLKTHTPGPWIETPTTYGNPRKPYSLRMDVVTTSGEWNPAFVAGDMLPEDARLISSAPELLAALERLAHPMADDEDLNHAREVIARAKGLSNDS
jgi:hypothetical protein